MRTTDRIPIKEAVSSDITVQVLRHRPVTVGGVSLTTDWRYPARTCLNPSTFYTGNCFAPWQLLIMLTTLRRLRGVFPQRNPPAETSPPLQTSPRTSTSSPPEIRSSLQDEAFAVKMLLGRCQVAKNDYKCPCKNGKSVSRTGVLDKTALCEECIHPLYLHDQFTGK